MSFLDNEAQEEGSLLDEDLSLDGDDNHEGGGGAPGEPQAAFIDHSPIKPPTKRPRPPPLEPIMAESDSDSDVEGGAAEEGQLDRCVRFFWANTQSFVCCVRLSCVLLLCRP